jgi:WD40 repeat protein
MQVWSNPVRQQFNNSVLPPYVTIISDAVPETVEDPCELTLLGHTSGVRCCSYSRNGSFIASTSEDGSLRVWDTGCGVDGNEEAAGTEAEQNGGGGGVGAERLVVTGLPGPTYPALADPYHGERQCCFSADGRHVATGSEDGWLQIWDLTGAQV